MTKEQLEALGLDEEQIKEIFRLNGIAVNSAQGDLEAKETELETLQGQLETANKEIEDFKDLDVDEIKTRADKYKQDYEALELKVKEDMEALKFEHELEGAIRDSKAKNVKAVKALIDIDSLKDSKNRLDDIKQALEATKEENDYLFGSDEPSGTGGSLGNTGKGGTIPGKTVTNDFMELAEEANIRK